VADLQPGDGLNDIPIYHTHNIANRGVLVPTQHQVHETDYDSRSLHRQNIQSLVTRFAVLMHSAAELLEIDFRRQ